MPESVGWSLPGVVLRRCETWDLAVTGAAFTGGTHSYVAPVRRGDGTEAVLKVPAVDEENRAEATALFHCDGDGAVRLYEFDPDSGAMLLELADPGAPLVRQGLDGLHGAHQEGLPGNTDRIDLACALYRRLRRCPTAAPPGFPELPSAGRLAASWSVRLPMRAKALGEMVIPSDLVLRLIATPDGGHGSRRTFPARVDRYRR